MQQLLHNGHRLELTIRRLVVSVAWKFVLALEESDHETLERVGLMTYVPNNGSPAMNGTGDQDCASISLKLSYRP